MKFKKVSTNYDGSPDSLSSEILFRQDSLPCGMMDRSPKPLNLSSYSYYPPSGIAGHSASITTSPVTNLDIMGRGFPYQQTPYYNNLPTASGLDALSHRATENLPLTTVGTSHQQNTINYQTQQNGHGQYYQTHYYANSSN